MAGIIKQNELNDLRKQHTTLVEEHEQLSKSMQSMGTLSAQLVESTKTVKALEDRLETTNAQVPIGLTILHYHVILCICMHDLSDIGTYYEILL